MNPNDPVLPNDPHDPGNPDDPDGAAPNAPLQNEQRRTENLSLYGSWQRAKESDVDFSRASIPVDSDDVRYKPLSLPLLFRLLEWLGPYRRLYIIGTVVGLAALAFELVTPVIAQRIIDVAIPSGQAEQVINLAGLWLGLMIVSLVLSGAQLGITFRAGQWVIHDMRLAIFRKLQDLSMGFFDRTKLGRIITRGTSDLEALRGAVLNGIFLMTSNTLMMVGAGTMILLIDLRLFLALVWLLPLIFILNRRFRRTVGQQYQIARADLSRLSSNLAENITGVRIVSSFNRQEANLGRFNELQMINMVNNLRLAHINGIYQPLLELFRFLGQAIVLTLGGLLMMRGEITAGSVLAIFFYWGFFMRPAITMGTFYNQLMMAMASSERIFSLLDLEPDVKDPAPAGDDGELAPDLPPLEGHVEFRDLCYGYEPNRPVLHDINLEIPAGRTCALVGTTGSGKTTMLGLLARFYDWEQGQILLDGLNPQTHTLRSLRQQIGLVLQTNYLFTGSILENIRYGKPDATDDEVRAVAESLDIHDTFLSLTAGYRTEVGERGSLLSQGIRQLVCFARVMLVEPRILLLDEATSAIDTVTEQKVQSALERLKRGRTTVIVAHRLSTIVQADCIVVMAHGRIIETGTHAELLEQGGSYAGMYERFVSTGG